MTCLRAMCIVIAGATLTGFGGGLGEPDEFSRVHPFAAGERASYRVGWGIFSGAGTATIVLDSDTVRGMAALHATFRVHGGIPGARINERLESWMDTSSLVSFRYLQSTRYPRFSRERRREFYPAEGRWTGHTNDKPEQGTLPNDAPLDEIGFLYFVRTLDLTVDHTYEFNRYWKPEGNPVQLKVLRREIVRVPAGTFSTVVVQPLIKTSGLFSEGGEAEVYISEGPHREIVMLRVKLSVATLTLRLEKYESGER